MYCVLEGKRSLRGDRYWGMYNVLCLEGKRSLRGDRYWGMYNVLCIGGEEKIKGRQILRNVQCIVFGG
jgi:hypothetical protein